MRAESPPIVPPGMEHAERGHHGAPEVEARPGDSLRRFVLGLVAAFAALFIGVGGVNAVVDPYGTVGTGLLPTLVFSDHAVKVGLIDKLHAAPQVLVLGSSRALKAEPSWIQKQTGLTGFNASSASARTEEAWGYVNLLHDRFPKAAAPRYVWFIEPELFRYGRTNPLLLGNDQLGRYYDAGTKGASLLADTEQLFSWKELRDSQKVVRAEIKGEHPPTYATFAPDGFRIEDRHDRLFEHGDTLAAELRKGTSDWLASFRANFGPSPGGLAPGEEASFERTVLLMNSWQRAPVLVLTPIHPTYERALGPRGMNHMHATLLAYLASLQRRGFKFSVVDATDISSFGGVASQFYDPIHLKLSNMRKLLDLVIARSRSALQ